MADPLHSELPLRPALVSGQGVTMTMNSKRPLTTFGASTGLPDSKRVKADVGITNAKQPNPSAPPQDLGLSFSKGVPDVSLDEFKRSQEQRERTVNALLGDLHGVMKDEETAVFSALMGLFYAEQRLLETFAIVRKRDEAHAALKKKQARAEATRKDLKRARAERDAARRERDEMARELALLKALSE